MRKLSSRWPDDSSSTRRWRTAAPIIRGSTFCAKCLICRSLDGSTEVQAGKARCSAGRRAWAGGSEASRQRAASRRPSRGTNKNPPDLRRSGHERTHGLRAHARRPCAARPHDSVLHPEQPRATATSRPGPHALPGRARISGCGGASANADRRHRRSVELIGRRPPGSPGHFAPWFCSRVSRASPMGG